MTTDGKRFRRPQSVLIVVYSRTLEVLLLERIDPPGFWQSVTGTLRWDEEPDAAARRELAEETGLDPSGLVDTGVTRRFPILPAWRDRYAPDVTENLEHRWYLELPAPIDVTINPAEHEGYEWLTLDAAIGRVASWTNREALEDLRP